MGQEQSRERFKAGTLCSVVLADSKRRRWSAENDEDVIRSARSHLNNNSKWHVARVLPYSVSNQNENDHDYLARILVNGNKKLVLMDSFNANDDENEFSLTGVPKYPCYVDRELPGEVTSHKARGYPTNANAWDEDVDDWCTQVSPRQEIARSVTTDEFTEDAPLIYDMVDKKVYQPLITKAGSRLWSISFVGSNNNNNDKNKNVSVNNLKAGFPGQLLVRIDKGRQMLMYDAFEYHGENPTEEIIQQYEETGQLPECSLDELRAVERKLKVARTTAPSLMLSREEMLKPLGDDHSMEDRMKHIGLDIFLPLLEMIRFNRSRIFRVRFPFHAIVGACLLILDVERPQETTAPLPKTEYPISALGQPHLREEEEDRKEADGNDEYRAKPGTFEHCDETIEPLGVLVLEVNKQYLNQAEYSCTVTTPINLRRDGRRFPIQNDWTPNQAFSNSTRHYIVGDASEIRELTEFLIDTSPRFQALLAPQLLVKTFMRDEKEEEQQPGDKNDDDENCKPKAKESNNNNKDGEDDKELPQKKKQRMDLDPAMLQEAMQAANTLNNGPISSILKLDPATIPSVQSLSSKTAFQLLEQAGILPPTTTRESSNKSNKPKRPFTTTKQVDDFLRIQCGIKRDVDNNCFKAGLLNGSIPIPPEFLNAKENDDAQGFLQHVICKLPCLNCTDQELSITVKRALKDVNECGSYWDSSGTIRCPECNEDFVVTNLCGGNPGLDRGKFHNHCDYCPDFGECIGDYRQAHCHACGEHYFKGMSGFSCPCQGDDRDDGFGPAYHSDTDDDEDERGAVSNVDEFFDSRNKSGVLTSMYTPPRQNAWSGLYLKEPYQPKEDPSSLLEPMAQSNNHDDTDE